MANGDSRLALPAVPRAAGIAREFVRRNWSNLATPDTLDCVTLCVSELVTNAIDHATPPYEIRLDASPDSLRVEVADTSPRRPVVRPVTPAAARGRGMFIVSNTATSWGVEATSQGKTVWAEFATTNGADTTDVVTLGTQKGHFRDEPTVERQSAAGRHPGRRPLGCRADAGDRRARHRQDAAGAAVRLR